MAKNKSVYIFAVSNSVEKELADSIYKNGIELEEVFRPSVGTIPNYYKLVQSKLMGFFGNLYFVRANDFKTAMRLIEEFVQNVKVYGAWDRKAFENIDNGICKYSSIGKGQRMMYWENTESERVAIGLVIKSKEEVVVKGAVAVYEMNDYLEHCRKAVRG